ncbi:MAG: cytochrome c [Candidatus Kapabacteria bacterium]|nr:cytochrome c [Candidatus Kapabacteria bacterium]
MSDNKFQYEDEIDFKAVLRTPIRWFGIIYPYFLVIAIAIGMIWVFKMDILFNNKIPPALVDSTRIFKDIEQKKGFTLAGVDVIKLYSEREQLKSKGEEIYKANCSSCHGDKGLGDGVAGANLNPKPRNFTQSTGWKNGRKFSDMYKTLVEGIPGGAMVSYDYLPIEDKFSLIFHIQTLATDFPQVTETELKDLDVAYNLSQTRTMPNQIPVQTAIMKLSSEKISEKDKINKIQEFIDIHSNPAKDIFQSVTYNQEKALLTLFSNQNWRAEKENFVKLISSSVNQNGFNSKALMLNEERLNLLYNYMIYLFSL